MKKVYPTQSINIPTSLDTLSALAILQLAEKIKSKLEKPYRIKVKGETVLVYPNDILYVQGNKNNCYIYCHNSKGDVIRYEATGYISDFEELFANDTRFIKCSRSYIINKDKVIGVGKIDYRNCVYFHSDLQRSELKAYYTRDYKDIIDTLFLGN